MKPFAFFVLVLLGLLLGACSADAAVTSETSVVLSTSVPQTQAEYIKVQWVRAAMDAAGTLYLVDDESGDKHEVVISISRLEDATSYMVTDRTIGKRLCGVIKSDAGGGSASFTEGEYICTLELEFYAHGKWSVGYGTEIEASTVTGIFVPLADTKISQIAASGGPTGPVTVSITKDDATTRALVDGTMVCEITTTNGTSSSYSLDQVEDILGVRCQDDKTFGFGVVVFATDWVIISNN